MLGTDYVENWKIFCPEQGDFRVDRSCARAINHLGLCVYDSHTHNKDIVLCYLNFKGTFPSADHDQPVRTLDFLGLLEDIVIISTNIYNGANTEFITPTATLLPSGSIEANSTATPFLLSYLIS